MRDGWREFELGDIIEFVRNGLNEKQSDDASGLPVTRIETISGDRINPDRVRYISKISPERISKFTLKDGDILFSHINSLPQIGRAVRYRGDPSPLLHGMNLLAIRANCDLVLPEFLELSLQRLRKQGHFRDIASRAVNQVSINQKTLKAVRVALPSLVEQRRISDLLAHVDHVIALGGTYAIEVRRSLLSTLLSGEHAIPASYDRFLEEAA